MTAFQQNGRYFVKPFAVFFGMPFAVPSAKPSATGFRNAKSIRKDMRWCSCFWARPPNVCAVPQPAAPSHVRLSIRISVRAQSPVHSPPPSSTPHPHRTLCVFFFIIAYR